ncbi:MAG: carbohydrate ABC transporter permease, partial [Caldilineaceae bacterium]
MSSHRRTSPVVWILVIGAMVIMLFWVLFPFYWAAINSVKKLSDVFKPNTWVPFLTFEPTLETWISSLSQREIRRALLNSTMIAVGSATLSTALGTLAAYALARFRFGMSSGSLTTWFLSQRILPPVVVVLPFFLIMSTIGAIDTIWSL